MVIAGMSADARVVTSGVFVPALEVAARLIRPGIFVGRSGAMICPELLIVPQPASPGWPGHSKNLQ